MKRIFLQLLIAAVFAMAIPASGQTGRQLIDISGHPFKGPADAPVTVVVFSDYL